MSVETGDPRTIQVRRPSDGGLVGEVPIEGPDAVREAVERARVVQRGWASLSVADRLRRLEGLHRAIGEGAEDVAEVIRSETGKPEVEALSEVVVALDLLRFYRKNAGDVLGRKRVSTGWLLGRKAWIEREPYGVVGVISPWNYPFILAMDPVVTALVAGNGVVLKPSEFTAFSGLRVEELCREAGLPEGLVRVVTGDGRTGDALVRSGVDKVVFTGSPATGRKVLAAAAENLTPVTLELGGKDPALVLEDADLERAARGIVFGAFYNAGQTCISTERVLVVDAVYDAFVKRVTELTEALRAGSAGGGDVGPMTTPDQLRTVEAHVEEAVAGGARVLVGGDRTDPASNVYLPTVLVDVKPEMRVVREETFGPVMPILRVRDAEEAVRRANESPFGLFASVWTGDRERGIAVARKLRAGGVSVNDTLSHYAVPGLPMGGVGESGFGRTRGLEGLRELSRTRSLLVDRTGLSGDPWWFPYTGARVRVVRALAEFRKDPGLRGVFRAVGTLLGGRGG